MANIEKLHNMLQSKIENIAGVKVSFHLCSDGIAIVSWEGNTEEPFNKLQKVLGSRAYDFDVDTELGYTFSGCLINLNK